MSNKRIFLSSPHMGEFERKFVKEAFDTNWIAPLGPNVNEFEKELSEYACKSENVILLREDGDEDIRPPFFRDIDRIIHSLAYTRYIDKTQVYSFIENDHITHRVLHVQLVSKIARTIGRSLMLNEDLIEAIALGHDVGHSPFGHKGETYLNNLSQREDIGYFYHNAQSVRVLKDLEHLNVSVQTLDGILAHNGEILINKYEYNSNKTKEEFLQELHDVFYKKDYSKKILPMTLEGAVVRLSDIIAYIGRDIEDSIKIGIIKREDIPQNITKVLGDNNSKMVDTLIKDIIVNSMEKPYLNPTRTENDFVEAIRALVETDPEAPWIFVCDGLNTHKSESLVRFVAEQCGLSEDLGMFFAPTFCRMLQHLSSSLQEPDV